MEKLALLNIIMANSESKHLQDKQMLKILEVIATVGSYNKFLVAEDGFVSISARFFQSQVRDYRIYLDYLIERNIVESDNRYIKGEKCKSYRFSKKYENVVIGHFFTRSLVKVRPSKKEAAELPVKYRFLTEYYNKHLTIERDLAVDYLKSEYSRGLLNCTQVTCSLAAIERIRNGVFNVSVDDNVFRLHSVITNLKSELRPFLRFNNVPLVSIDICNSQPYLCSLIISEGFWTSNTLFSTDEMNALINSVFRSRSEYESFIMLCKSVEQTENSDVRIFKRIVSEGMFYEHLEQQLFSDHNQTSYSRKEIKELVFKVLYTDNRFKGQHEAKPKRDFIKLFPDVYRFLAFIKRGNKSKLPCLLQRIESKIVLEVICKKISNTFPAIPIITIHDSICTIKGCEKEVLQIMKNELTACVGIRPYLKMEYW